MTNSRASKAGVYTIQENVTTSGTQTEVDFNLTNDNFDNTAEYMLIINGGTTASLALGIQVNGISTSQYYMEGRSILAGTETLLDEGASSRSNIFTATLATTAVGFSSKTRITFTKVGPTQRAIFMSEAFAHTTQMNQTTKGHLQTAITSLNSIKVIVSTSTLVSGTRLTLYKLKT